MNLSILNTVAFCIMDSKILACVGEGVTLIKTNFFCKLSLLSQIPILFTDRVASGQRL